MTPSSRSKRPERLLTESELELMTILWREGGSTAGEVLEALPAQRPLAYTSVSTILRILEQKGVVNSEKVGRGHRYVPAVDKKDYEAFALGQVVNKVFDGQPLSLVRRLVDTAGLTRQDIAELKDLLDQTDRSRPR